VKLRDLPFALAGLAFGWFLVGVVHRTVRATAPRPSRLERSLSAMATGGLFVGVSELGGDLWVAAITAAFTGVALALAESDWHHRVIPNAITYPSLVVSAAALAGAAVADRPVDLEAAGLGLLAYGGGLFVVALIAPRGMGMGDVKLAALAGLVLGSRGLGAVAVAAGLGVLLGGVGAGVALALGQSRKSQIPYGPFLAAGAIAAALWAHPLEQVYLSRLR